MRRQTELKTVHQEAPERTTLKSVLSGSRETQPVTTIERSIEITPSIDIFEDGGNLVLKAELPGIKREDINVKFVENNIVISGEKKTEQRVEEKDYLRLERSHGSFNRMLSLPDGVNTDKVKASFKDGVLEVRIPKTESKSAVRQVNVE